MNQKGAAAGLTAEFFAAEEAMGVEYAQAQRDLVETAKDTLLPGYEMKSLARHEIGADKGFVGPYDRMGWRLQREAIEEGRLDKYAAVGWRGEDREDFFVVGAEKLDSCVVVRISASLSYAAQLADHANRVEQLIGFSRKAWTSLPVFYGCANLGVSDESGSGRMAGTLIGHWTEQSKVTLADFTPPRQDKLACRLSSKVKGAFWLNLLSDAHVEALGGLSAVDEALPEDIRIEEFKRGGMLIQLTQTPELDNSPETQAKFESLRGLLAPILVE
jgi:hypothetical protein